MCGILGILGENDDSLLERAKKMLVAQANRGPDAHRIVKTKNSLGL